MFASPYWPYPYIHTYSVYIYIYIVHSVIRSLTAPTFVWCRPRYIDVCVLVGLVRPDSETTVLQCRVHTVVVVVVAIIVFVYKHTHIYLYRQYNRAYIQYKHIHRQQTVDAEYCAAKNGNAYKQNGNSVEWDLRDIRSSDSEPKFTFTHSRKVYQKIYRVIII